MMFEKLSKRKTENKPDTQKHEGNGLDFLDWRLSGELKTLRGQVIALEESSELSAVSAAQTALDDSRRKLDELELQAALESIGADSEPDLAGRIVKATAEYNDAMNAFRIAQLKNKAVAERLRTLRTAKQEAVDRAQLKCAEVRARIALAAQQELVNALGNIKKLAGELQAQHFENIELYPQCYGVEARRVVREGNAGLHPGIDDQFMTEIKSAVRSLQEAIAHNKQKHLKFSRSLELQNQKEKK